MITKVIGIADIHFPLLNGIEELEVVLNNFIEDIKKIVEKEGKDNTRIVICGDTFHNKINISAENMIHVYKFFTQLNNICKTYVISGNHDMLMNNMKRVDALIPLFEIGHLPNVIYLDKELNFKSGCYKDDNVVWCLYSSYEVFNSPDIEAFKTKSKSKTPLTYIGLIHTDINGAITTTNYVTETGVDPNIFEECDFVIAGHIHKKQEIKKNGVKIVYCSSISQKNYGESITGHGYVLWDISDPEDITYEYHEVKNEDGGYFVFNIDDIDDIKNDEEELINL